LSRALEAYRYRSEDVMLLAGLGFRMLTFPHLLPPSRKRVVSDTGSCPLSQHSDMDRI